MDFSKGFHDRLLLPYRENGLEPDLRLGMKFSFVSNVRLGVVVSPEGPEAFGVETTLVIISYGSGTCIENGLPDRFKMACRDKCDKFFQLLFHWLENPLVLQAQKVGNFGIYAPRDAVDICMSGIDGNVIPDCFDDDSLNRILACQFPDASKNDGMVGYNQ